MSINSYITHRMFVAALKQDETAPAKTLESERAKVRGQNGSTKVPWDVRFVTLSESKAATSNWAPSPSGGA